MIVTYFIESRKLIMAVPGFPELKEGGEQLWINDPKKGWRVLLNGLHTRAEYKEMPDQPVNIPKRYWEDDGILMDEEIPQTLEELNLRDFTPEELEERQKPSIKERLSALEAIVLNRRRNGN